MQNKILPEVKNKIQPLRSHKWLMHENMETRYLHRSAFASAGIDMSTYTGQPVIGIANTWSEVNSCNMSLNIIADHVKKGIKDAGAIALEFPTFSLGEDLMKPTAMLYRNMLAMVVEETIRSYPLDGIILLGNCDKTVPGLALGAISANLPFIQLNAGPKKVGLYNGKRMGSGTDLWKYAEALKLGEINEEEWLKVIESLSCGFGSCNTMGSASTMNGLLEVLGLMPLGLSTLPVASEKRYELSYNAGKRVVEMVSENLLPSTILTAAAFDNAIMLCMALGGSTNAIIHLTAMAGRLNIPLYPDRFNEVGSKIPCLTDVQPTGKYLIDEFDEAGGIPALLIALKDMLDLSAITFTGKNLAYHLKKAKPYKKGTDVIRPLKNPVTPAPTLVILHGNLAPGGALIKASAASGNLLIHKGPAVVFDDYKTMLAAVENPDNIFDSNAVLILRNAGPKGTPGMPEWGMIPIPLQLQKQGVKDMVRISDARMSGTSFGTVVVHVVPEAAAGGPLCLVKDGDIISLNVPERKLEVLISATEMRERHRLHKPILPIHKRGYLRIFENEILQADEGCDFKSLRPLTKDALEFTDPIIGRS